MIVGVSKWLVGVIKYLLGVSKCLKGVPENLSKIQLTWKYQWGTTPKNNLFVVNYYNHNLLYKLGCLQKNRPQLDQYWPSYGLVKNI